MTINTQFYLLRHGDTGQSGFRGKTNDPLTARGQRQMQDAINYSQLQFDLILTSPLQRCCDFALQLSRQHQIPVTIEESLQEMDFGEWEGLSAEQVMVKHADALGLFWKDPYTNTPPGGEDLQKFTRRVSDCLSHYACTHSTQRILVITHGGVIRVLLALDQQLSADQLLTIQVPHASMHRIQIAC